MKYFVRITEQASFHLKEIITYIRDQLLSPTYAKSLLKAIREAINSLEFMPERHQIYQSNELAIEKEIRLIVVKKYNILYVADKSKMTVDIISISYGGKNVDAEVLKY